MTRLLLFLLGCTATITNAATFDFVTRLAASDPFADSSFGSAIAVNGQTLVVGASGHSEKGMVAGAAYVFVKSEGAWVPQATLFPDVSTDFQLFGASVAISGDTAVVGAVEVMDMQRGGVYVFVRENGAWTQQQRLFPSDGGDFDTFGVSVAIDGDTIAVGSYNVGDPVAPFSGAVYVFTRNAGVWTQQQKVLPNTPISGELMGSAVGFDGNTIVAGAPFADGFSGALYVFGKNGAEWTESARLVPTDTMSSGEFGTSVAVHGNTVIGGAPWNGDVAEANGAAWIFAFNGTEWVQQARLAGSSHPARNFGCAVAIRGDQAVVGAEREVDDFGQFTIREAYVFQRDGSVWTEAQRLTVDDPSTVEHAFGTAVSMSDGIIAIGDPAFAIASAAAYVFESAQNTAPLAACLVPVTTIECATNDTPAAITVNITDADGDALTVIWSVNGVPVETTQIPAGAATTGIDVTCTAVPLPIGANTFTASVSDGTAPAVECSSIVQLVADSQPPVITSISATPNVLSPANNKMIPVKVQVEATDNCSLPVSRIVAVTSDAVAPAQGKAKKNKPADDADDWVITGDLTVTLRAERNGGKKSPRTYTILVECVDAAGNASTETVQVLVP